MCAECVIVVEMRCFWMVLGIEMCFWESGRGGRGRSLNKMLMICGQDEQDGIFLILDLRRVWGWDAGEDGRLGTLEREMPHSGQY